MSIESLKPSKSAAFRFFCCTASKGAVETMTGANGRSMSAVRIREALSEVTVEGFRGMEMARNGMWLVIQSDLFGMP